MLSQVIFKNRFLNYLLVEKNHFSNILINGMPKNVAVTVTRGSARATL